MSLDRIAARGMVLLGCGKMGSALLAGWLERGVSPASVHVIDPAPSDWLRAQGVALNGPLPESPAVALLAVKPQMMGKALPVMTGFGGGARCLFPSRQARRLHISRTVLARAAPSSAPCPIRPPPSGGASRR